MPVSSDVVLDPDGEITASIPSTNRKPELVTAIGTIRPLFRPARGISIDLGEAYHTDQRGVGGASASTTRFLPNVS